MWVMLIRYVVTASPEYTGGEIVITPEECIDIVLFTTPDCDLNPFLHHCEPKGILRLCGELWPYDGREI